MHCKDRFAHARELFRESKILNIFQLNILNNLVFMHKIKSQTAPKLFQNKFHKPTQSILQIFQHSTIAHHHLNYASLNTEFQSETPHYGKIFLQTLRKCKKV